jgi:hypothetical protein
MNLADREPAAPLQSSPFILGLGSPAGYPALLKPKVGRLWQRVPSWTSAASFCIELRAALDDSLHALFSVGSVGHHQSRMELAF